MEEKTPEEFLRYIDIAENAKLSQTKKNDEYEILAITSCPTGIAHTYMAAEANTLSWVAQKKNDPQGSYFHEKAEAIRNKMYDLLWDEQASIIKEVPMDS